MTIVKVSPKYQILIPRKIREKMKLKPGQKFQIIEYNNRIEFILIKDIKEMRGILKGMDTTIKRDEDRNELD